MKPPNLADPGTLKGFLGRYGIRADKSLGQHFLCSSTVVDAIVARVHNYPGVLEIGPGPGVLTGPLSRQAEQMLALELDSKMIELLAESAPSAQIRNQDALKADLGAVLTELPTPRAVVSNLPYYITGPLLTRISEARSHFQLAVLMMQREVANRILAPPGNSNRGSLSVYLQAQFEIKLVCHAPAGAFLPPPKVDSTVLEFRPTPEQYSPGFFRLLRFGFAQPRKTLVNNLVAGYRVHRDIAVGWLKGIEIDEAVRPAVLTVPQWVQLDEVIGE